MRVVVARGVPGSGKTTLARTLAGVIVSADDYFLRSDGVYEFRGAELPQAHGACLRRFVALLLAGESPLIVVDNTNTTAAEIAPYAALALAYGAELEVVTVLCPPGRGRGALRPRRATAGGGDHGPEAAGGEAAAVVAGADSGLVEDDNADRR